MLQHSLHNWDDAYANAPHIVGGDAFPKAWADAAAAFRASGRHAMKLATPYGPAERQRFDLFLPEGAPRGLVVFIHGGYWLRFDSSYWSHLAQGPLRRGYGVAMPSYRLCPDVRIRDIVGDIGAAITSAASLVSGPIHLTGHSAGGHLASRMLATTAPLTPDVRARIDRAVSISGVHDLRPLLRTRMNADLRLDAEEARAESPALLEPVPGARLACWVGGAERAEFRRQNALLANVWTGLGAGTFCWEAPDKHHYTVIDELADADSGLVGALLD